MAQLDGMAGASGCPFEAIVTGTKQRVFT